MLEIFCKCNHEVLVSEFQTSYEERDTSRRESGDGRAEERGHLSLDAKQGREKGFL